MGCSDSKLSINSVDTGHEFVSFSNQNQTRNKPHDNRNRGGMEQTVVPVHQPAASGNEQGQSASNQPRVEPSSSNPQTDSAEEASSKECPICLESDRNAVIIPCGHTFCMECATTIQLTKKFCPTCRGDIVRVNQIFLS